MNISKVKFIEVTDENLEKKGLFCAKNKKTQGFQEKASWLREQLQRGLKMVIAEDEDEKQLGFIEFIPSEYAWRPICADNYLFIQCIVVGSKKMRNQGLGGELIRYCENTAIELGKDGVCVMTSNGAWISDRTLFAKNGYQMADQKGRFELMYKNLTKNAQVPLFNDWEKELHKYQGWNIVYSNQCPWHDKSVTDLLNVAMDNDLEVKVKKIEKPRDAQKAPTGYGSFALIKDGRLLEDHYISGTRFKNILKKELA